MNIALNDLTVGYDGEVFLLDFSLLLEFGEEIVTLHSPN